MPLNLSCLSSDDRVLILALTHTMYVMGPEASSMGEKKKDFNPLIYERSCEMSQLKDLSRLVFVPTINQLMLVPFIDLSIKSFLIILLFTLRVWKRPVIISKGHSVYSCCNHKGNQKPEGPGFKTLGSNRLSNLLSYCSELATH